MKSNPSLVHLSPLGGAFWAIIASMGTCSHPRCICTEYGAIAKTSCCQAGCGRQTNRDLRQYQWIETTQLIAEGDAKAPTQKLAYTVPTDRLQEDSIGPPRNTQRGQTESRESLKRKKGEMQEYMDEVKGLLSPGSATRRASYGRALIRRAKSQVNPAGGSVNWFLWGYALPGDRMTLAFDLGR